MFAVVNCLAFEHDLRLVVLAGALCFLSTLAAKLLLERARFTVSVARAIWVGAAGVTAGFGIWTTHFVAMLAYDPGVIFGYDLKLTLSSLLVAIATTTASSVCATYFVGRSSSWAAGILFGLGVSTMHFTGMMAVEFPGSIVWDQTLVACAVVIAISFAVPALSSWNNHKKVMYRIVLPATLLMLGIVAMHFTAMGAITAVPIEGNSSPNLISPQVMIVIVTSIALSLLIAGFAAAIFAIGAERAAAAGQTNFKLLVQGVTDYAIYMLDPEGHVSNWNAGAQRAKGYTAAEIVGQHFSRFYHPEDRAQGLPQHGLVTALAEGKFEAEGWRLRKDGSQFWAHVVIDPIFDDAGAHIGFAKITRDRTEQMLTARRLQETTDNLNLALDNMANAICLFDRDERLVLHNSRLYEIVGIPADTELNGQSFRDLCELRHGHDVESSGDPEEFYFSHKQLYEQPDGGETVRTIQNGNTVRVIHRPTGNGSWVTTIEDITERVKSEAKIAHLARHDALTTLPNRRHFVEALDAAIAHANESDLNVAAVCIDMDNFKEINDTFGHGVGDEVLVTLAKRLNALIGSGEAVARLGGDEFVAVKSYKDADDLRDFINKVHAALSGKISTTHTEIVPGASLGVAIYPQDAADREKLLANADMAMYRSKSSVDEKISYYQADMDEVARERRAMSRDIWTALEQQQFFLTYQVQRSIKTDDVTGYEVLLRWLHPTRGLVSPVEFIPVAEECGAITAIGDWVLEQACSEAALWHTDHKIAVNLSALQLNNVILIEKVQQVLLRTGLPPSRLELEVTESAIIGDKARALHILRQIKALGVTIAIDDFGTGYSSLETLRSFPFDKIKLDRSFVTEIETRQSKAFVRAIIALGKSLEVSVLAEGVETREQLAVLLTEGCDEVQGFLFGRPTRMNQQDSQEVIRTG